jgi:hypothetical protein
MAPPSTRTSTTANRTRLIVDMVPSATSIGSARKGCLGRGSPLYIECMSQFQRPVAQADCEPLWCP